MQTNAKIQYIIIMPENDNQRTGVKWVNWIQQSVQKYCLSLSKHWLDD